MGLTAPSCARVNPADVSGNQSSSRTVRWENAMRNDGTISSRKPLTWLRRSWRTVDSPRLHWVPSKTTTGTTTVLTRMARCTMTVHKLPSSPLDNGSCWPVRVEPRRPAKSRPRCVRRERKSWHLFRSTVSGLTIALGRIPQRPARRSTTTFPMNCLTGPMVC